MAESDCNLAIALDSNYFKAFARRGAARFALEKYDSALEGEASGALMPRRRLPGSVPPSLPPSVPPSLPPWLLL